MSIRRMTDVSSEQNGTTEKKYLPINISSLKLIFYDGGEEQSRTRSRRRRRRGNCLVLHPYSLFDVCHYFFSLFILFRKFSIFPMYFLSIKELGHQPANDSVYITFDRLKTKLGFKLNANEVLL